MAPADVPLPSPPSLSPRSNFYKHKNNNFFPGYIYVLVQLVIHIPFAFFESLIFTLCLYFLAGLSLDGGQVSGAMGNDTTTIPPQPP